MYKSEFERGLGLKTKDWKGKREIDLSLNGGGRGYWLWLNFSEKKERDNMRKEEVLRGRNRREVKKKMVTCMLGGWRWRHRHILSCKYFLLHLNIELKKKIKNMEALKGKIYGGTAEKKNCLVFFCEHFFYPFSILILFLCWMIFAK